MKFIIDVPARNNCTAKRLARELVRKWSHEYDTDVYIKTVSVGLRKSARRVTIEAEGPEQELIRL